MPFTTTEAINREYPNAAGAFVALTHEPHDSDGLLEAAVQTIVRNLGVDRCFIYKRRDSSLALVAAAGNDTSSAGTALEDVAIEALNQHRSGHVEPLRIDGALSLVIEGDSAPFGVCVAHRDAPLPFTCHDVEFVRSITVALSDAFLRAHSARDKARLSAIADSTGDAIVEVTTAARIFNCNAAAEALFGCSRNDIVGRSVTSLLDELQDSNALSIDAAVSSGEALGPQEARFRRADGSGINVRVRVTPIVLPDGRVTAATLTMRDVRETQATVRQLQMQTNILAQMPAAVMVWRLMDVEDSSSLRLAFANKAASVASGLPLEESTGARFQDVVFGPVTMRDAELCAGVARTGVPRDLGEHPGSAGDEASRWYHLLALPLPDECVAVVFQDVTERRTLTKQLEHAQRIEIMGRLAGGIAHDFNNLLTVVNGYSELLRGRVGTQPLAARDLDEIDRATDSARELTRQLLAFGRRQTLHPAAVDLTSLIRSARGMLARLIGEDVQLSVIGDEPVTVFADAGQINQVLLNLAVNARDAMPAGGKVVVESSVVHVGHDAYDNHGLAGAPAHVPAGVYGTLTVSDTGLGMDARTLARLFEPFFTTKEPGKGTGLGLSIVHGIVKQSGGHITVNSEPGRGTTFTIYLPMSDQRTVGASAVDAATKQRRRRAIVGERTVLVVEDDDAVRFVVGTILKQSGLRVLEAASAAHAHDVLSGFNGRVDLVLTDVVMAGQSGPELSSRLKVKFPAIQVVYMSGYERESAGHRKLPPGGNFLAKPFSPDELMDVVCDALEVA